MLSLPEAAAMLRCHPNTVRAWVRQGKLVPIPMGAEKVNMFLLADVERLKKPLERAGVIVKDDKHAFPVVGIGASAGGLDAITRLLKHLPTDLGLAYVFVTHQEKEQEKTLADVLRKKTAMPVFVVENGMKLEPDRLYVAPADMHTAVVNSTFTLQQPRGLSHTRSRPIDVFFTALANEYQNNAIGIVLSGGGLDGTEGLRAIKAEDGLTIVQDATAQDQSMPQTALEAEVVDLVRAPEAIASELVQLVKELFAGGQARIPSKHENELRRILQYLLEQRGIDFSEYKEATIHRRIIRRMVLSKCRKLSDYATLLRGTPTEVDTLCNDLLINVTSFFRDPAFHKALTEKVFPDLFADRSSTDPLRIWVAACAGGEEVVSIAITLLEFLGERAATTPVQIFATDLNERTIEKARLGVYKKSALQDMDPERLSKYFMHVDGHYQVIKPIRDLCVFAKHDLLKDPPFSRVDLISCQNVLIYLENTAQGRVLKSFHYALKPTGYLALGKSETTSTAEGYFQQPDRDHKVHLKKHKGSARLPAELRFKQGTVGMTTPMEPRPMLRPMAAPTDIERAVEHLLLQRYVPPSVLVNKDLEIVRFMGATAPFLAPNTGRASLSLLKMVREELTYELRALLKLARKEKAAVRKSGIPVRFSLGVQDVALEVVPVGDARDPHFLVLFKEDARVQVPTPTNGSAGARGNNARENRIAALEKELREAHEQVRLINEEAELHTQELQTANEEVVSSNEELQSINEEMETSKEELQSINEEYATINEELRVRNEALQESEERLRMATEAGKVGLWDLDIAADRLTWSDSLYAIHGVKKETFEATVQNFRQLVHADDRERWKEVVDHAIRHDAKYEIEFRAVRPNGEVFWLYTNATLLRVDGRAVRMMGATLDITERKRSEQALAASAARMRLATVATGVGIWEWNVQTGAITWDEEMFRIYGVAPTKNGEVVYTTWSEAVLPEDLAHQEAILQETLRTGIQSTREFRIVCARDGEQRYIRSVETVRKDEHGQTLWVVGTNLDITDAKNAENALRDSEERFKAIYDRAPLGVALSTMEGLVVDANPAFANMLGFQIEEMIGHTSTELGVIHRQEQRLSIINELKSTGHVRNAEVDMIRKDGAHVVIHLNMDVVSIGGKAYNMGVFDDITERRAAEDAQRRLAAIVESSDDAILSRDLNGIITSWNQGAERMFGFTPPEIIGEPNALFIPPDLQEEEERILNKVRQGERVLHYETVRLHKNGTPVQVALTLSPLKNDQGEIIGASKVIRDITEQKRAQEAVRVSEARFHLLADNMAQLAWIAEPNGEIHWYNKRWFDHTGTTLDEMRGWGWQKIHHPDHVDRVTAKFKEHIFGEKDWEDTFPIRSADGEYRWFLSRAFPVRDANGRVLRWFGTNTDITEERNAQQDLIESEERRRLLADNMSQMAYVADANGQTTWVNRRWTEYTGQNVVDMNDRGWSKVVHPDHLDAMITSFATAQKNGVPWEHVFRLRNTLGEYRWFLSRSVPIKNEDGVVERWFGTNTDITDQKLAEEALHESAKHKDHFLATLAHELRNPLAPLKNGLQLMELAPDDPQLLETTRAMMVRQLDHMVRLVDDLMDLSRISRGKIDLIMEDVQLAEVIGTAMEASKPLIERNQHQLHVDVSAEGLRLHGDAARLTQVVSNLLNNAAKYTPRGGRIDLVVNREEECAVIRVRDTGIGIDPSAIGRVFDMFAQVDPQQKGQNAGGLGIGLNVVQRLVRMHKGEVEAHSEGLGKGSEFVVRLPLVNAPEKPKPVVVVSEPPTSSRRVLVVDDNEDIALSMSLLLKKTGHVVAVAHDGTHAVGMAETFKPEVILMDIGMPKMNGYEACAAIRATEFGKYIHIIAVSGWGQEEDRRKSQDAGFDGHVVKPMDRATLERLIAEARPHGGG
jgi:two-component system, chemotaxis family, CheB/CheR fusion protein